MKLWNIILDKYMYFLAKVSRNSYLSLESQENVSPLFLMGMYRSGTSLTSQILEGLGVDFGSDYRLLKSQGVLKELNPDGFYEDFLFAQLARFFFYKMGKDGSNPPSINEVEQFIPNKILLSDFILYSYFTVKEDRISSYHKAKCLTRLRFKKMNYLLGKKNVAIKIPMLVPFHVFLRKIYPKSKFLIIIRNPDSTIKSSKALTNRAAIELFDEYYIHLIELFKSNSCHTIVFSYDKLLESPAESVKLLSDALHLSYREDVSKLIKGQYIRNQIENNSKSDYYDFLFQNAINRFQ